MRPKFPTTLRCTMRAGTRTFGQLAAAAAGIAQLLTGVTNRPSVGLMLPAGAGFVASFYGTLLAGKSVVPINFLLGEKEIAHVIADSGIDTIISIPQLSGKFNVPGLKIIDLVELAKRAAESGRAPGDALEALKTRLPNPKPDDLAVLMYTSGTSGLPKGVVLTFNNLQSDVDACIEHARLEHKHKFLGVIPLFHAFGMTAMMLAPIQLGSTVIYMARFSAVGALNAIREHGVSLMFGVPSMLAAIAHLKSAVAEDFKTIYAMISGGEPLPARLREVFHERFGLNLFEGYGLTETSPVVSLNTPQAHRAGSVGKPLRVVEVKIADENGGALPAGQSGEVWLRGPMIMKEYFNLPKETEAALTPDRFFKTGDLGMLDTEGFLYITGRKKDLIIVAGEKVCAAGGGRSADGPSGGCGGGRGGKEGRGPGGAGGGVCDWAGRTGVESRSVAGFLPGTWACAVEDSAGISFSEGFAAVADGEGAEAGVGGRSESGGVTGTRGAAHRR